MRCRARLRPEHDINRQQVPLLSSEWTSKPIHENSMRIRGQLAMNQKLHSWNHRVNIDFSRLFCQPPPKKDSNFNIRKEVSRREKRFKFQETPRYFHCQRKNAKIPSSPVFIHEWKRSCGEQLSVEIVENVEQRGRLTSFSATSTQPEQWIVFHVITKCLTTATTTAVLCRGARKKRVSNRAEHKLINFFPRDFAFKLARNRISIYMVIWVKASGFDGRSSRGIIRRRVLRKTFYLCAKKAREKEKIFDSENRSLIELCSCEAEYLI